MYSFRLLVVYYLLFTRSLQIEIDDEGKVSGNDQLLNMLIDDFGDGFHDDSSSDYNCPLKCNPNADKFCLVNNEALGTSIFDSFSKGTNYFSITSSKKGIDFGEDGMELTIKNKFENPALTSSFYIMYGKVEAEIKGAFGSGIVSSLYLQSDDLDEIDIAEILGGDPFNYQTNYFIKGNVTTYDRERCHKLQISPLKEYYKYGVKWTPSKIVWYLDDQPVRQLRRGNRQGFPTSPMAIKISLWAGEDTENEGTIAWSKGLTNYQDGPFTMNIKNLVVSDYSSGQSYSYGWLPNGSWLDLVAKNGEIFKTRGIDDEEKTGLLRTPPDYTNDLTVPRERHGDWTASHERAWSPTWLATLTELTGYASITDEMDTQYEPVYREKAPIDFAFPTLPVNQSIYKKVVGKGRIDLVPATKSTVASSELISESWFATTSMMSTEYHFTTLIHNSKMVAKPTAHAKSEKIKPNKVKPETTKPEKDKVNKVNTVKTKPANAKPTKIDKLVKPTMPKKPPTTTELTKPTWTIRSTTTTVQTEFIQFPEEQHYHYHPNHKTGTHGQRFRSGVANEFAIPVLTIIFTGLVLLLTSL